MRDTLQISQSYKSPILQSFKAFYSQPSQPIPNQKTPLQLSQSQLQTFKTLPCPHFPLSNATSTPGSSACLSGQLVSWHRPLESPYYFSCSFFHTDKDRRRNPYHPDGSLLYQPLFYGDFGGEMCANWIEFLYHPDVYKTAPCIVGHCVRKYCSKVHEGENWKMKQKVEVDEKHACKLTESVKEISSIRQNKMEILTAETKIEYIRTQARISLNLAQINELQAKETKKEEQIQTQIQNLAHQTSQKPQSPQSIGPSPQKILKYRAKSPSIAPSLCSVSNSHSHKQLDYDRLFFMEHLKIVEDRTHEFKMFKDKDPRRISAIVLEYISAFLNSDGGSIYLGINDESVVHGLDVTQKWLDQFKLAVDTDGRFHMNPPLIPQKYDLRVIPVSHPKKIELVVVQIKVFPQQESEKKVLTLYKKECYLRMNASNHRLTASDIMEYMRLMHSKQSLTTPSAALQQLELPEQKLLALPMKQLKQLQDYSKKMSGKVTSVLRRKELGGVVITTAKADDSDDV